MSPAAEELAARIRSRLGARPDLIEKKMFGGLAFMLSGHMLACAKRDGGLLIRVGADAQDEALRRPGAALMVHGGRVMTGFINVYDDGLEDEALLAWLQDGERFVASLPPKPAPLGTR